MVDIVFAAYKKTKVRASFFKLESNETHQRIMRVTWEARVIFCSLLILVGFRLNLLKNEATCPTMCFSRVDVIYQ